MNLEQRITQEAQRLGQCLSERDQRCAVAESCTGGLVAAAITAIPGSSAWFDLGLVTYSVEAKQRYLGVDANVLKKHGAVSAEVAQAMALGALNSQATWSIAVTGIAGPDGGSNAQPVGTVWIAWAHRDHAPQAALYALMGDREAIRQQAVFRALEGLVARLMAC